MNVVHTPVLREELIRFLKPRKEGEFMIDATQGEGGHSYEFLSRFPELKILGIDADPEIQETAKERLKIFGRRAMFFSGWSQDYFTGQGQIELIQGEFNHNDRPDTILMDLGISLFHYEKSGRGFSFHRSEPLDMRIRGDLKQTAADFINNLSEKDLADLLFVNAEERFSRRIAAEISAARKRSPITDSAVLAEIVRRAVPAAARNGPVHPATKTFLALRIAVNGELSDLRGLLEAALAKLKPGGRIGVISFHSLEDRIVKNFFREKNRDCICPPEEPMCKCRGVRIVEILTKKGIVPDPVEIRENPPSRSARLRAAEKLGDEVFKC